ncbi:response regulator [Candidatus Saganbacteria bacterium]|uniref:Response regulator n=1 Tax=Candidatus Saganbacteria bacterium TaxID=2575572 RepID=A0A9D6UMC2_UNCSA|nr:response regulator [Candidatus Saganbacteria bacterium]
MARPAVLVVDDEKEIADEIAELLGKEGKYEVVKAYSGKEALKVVEKKNKGLFKSGKIKLVLMDIKMPDLDGVETLSRMLEIDKDLHAVMVTAYDEDNYWIDSIFLGKAVGYILKPFKNEDLLSKVDDFFRGKADALKTASAREYILSRNKEGVKESLSPPL